MPEPATRQAGNVKVNEKTVSAFIYASYVKNVMPLIRSINLTDKANSYKLIH